MDHLRGVYESVPLGETDVDLVYSEESVRSTIHRLYGQHPAAPVKLPHATVPSITAELVNKHARVFDTIVDTIRGQLRSEQQHSCDEAAESTAIASHWLLSVPAPLRLSEEDTVNYLGMLVAIDFCHWAEVRQPAAASEGGKGVEEAEEEEGGIVAAPGEEVTGFAGFYTVVEDELAAANENSSSLPPSQFSGSTDGLLTEPKGAVDGQANTAQDVTLLRGSAAMMLLLRRAVEVHHIPWYDIHYLQQFNGDVDAALGALRVCFMGCEKDGVTPLWMPCTRTRVQLLLSLADAFEKEQKSFFKLLCECAGFMFRPPADSAAAREGVRGFVPSLVRVHPRYRDFCREAGNETSVSSEGQEAAYVPVLKLSQLTALALEEALPDLWKHRCAVHAASPSPPPPPLPLMCPKWMAARGEAVSGVTSPFHTGLFTDGAELSICCDYQIPKTLRAVGLIAYDDDLAYKVDHHVLLRPGSAEETSIRLATLVAAERLLAFLNTHHSHALRAQDDSADAATTSAACTVNHLDHALWYVGRYMVTSEARHHLCRTIMY